MRTNGLARAVCAALGIAAVLALAGCSKPQAPPATPASLTVATPAATAALPQGAYYDEPAAAGAAPNDGVAPAAPAPRAAPPASADPPPAARPEFAQVVAVQPVTQTFATSRPHRVCREEQVAVPVPYRDQNQVGGAVAGGVLGALAGHMIGGGHGRTLMTLAGAAGGAFAGHEIQKRHQEDNATEMQTRNVCHTVTDHATSTRTVAYDVTYTLDGRTGHLQMARAPMVGSGLPVHDGAVVVPGALAAR